MWYAHHIISTNQDHHEIVAAMVQDLSINGITTEEDRMILYYEDETIHRVVIERTAHLMNEHAHRIERIPDQNWNKSWESNYAPVKIDDFCVIYAPFHQVDLASFKHRIEIQPQMSFGTGHHQTTRMMVNQLRHIDVSGSIVVDFGAGTGILAILAEKMGAHHVDGIEYDAVAVENMIENGQRNRTKNIGWTHADHLRGIADHSCDVVLANILRSVILDHLDDILRVVKPTGTVVCSGYHESEKHHIEEACSVMGWHPLRTYVDDLWCCQSFSQCS